MKGKGRLGLVAAFGICIAAGALTRGSEAGGSEPGAVREEADGIAPAGAGLEPATRIQSLRVTIKTTNRSDAGTDATVYLVVSMKNHTSGGIVIRLPDQKGDDNETGKTTKCSFKLSEALPARISSEQFTEENITGMTLVNGMDGGSAGWHVESVKIEASRSAAVSPNGENWTIVDQSVNRWLDTKEMVGPAAPLKVLAPWRFSKGE